VGTAVAVLIAGALAVSPAYGATDWGADLTLPNSAGQLLDCATVTFSAGASGDGCAGILTYINGSVAASAPVGGVLTSFSIKMQTAVPAGHVMLFSVSGTPDNGTLTTVGAGTDVSVPGDSAVHAFNTRIPIAAGMLIGFTTPTAAVYRTNGDSTNERIVHGSSPGTQPQEGNLDVATRQAIQAPLRGHIEPDADGDGYGDETQDACPSDATTHGACPTPTPTPTPTPQPGPSPDATPPAQTPPGPQAPAADTTPPAVSHLTMSPPKFRVNKRGRAALAKGSSLRFTSSEAGTATMSVLKLRPHRKPDPVAQFNKPAVAGANRIAFAGRVHVGSLVKTLAPGNYQLVLRVADAAGNKSKTASCRFTIVR